VTAPPAQRSTAPQAVVEAPSPKPTPPPAERIFVTFGADLWAEFNAADRSYNAAVDAAMNDAARAERTGSDRVHARLSAFQRAEDLALAAPPAAELAPPAPPADGQQQNPEPAPALGGRAEEALTTFLEAHDEQDRAEAGEPDVPGPDAVPREAPTAAARGQHDGTAHASTGRSEVNSGPGTPDGGAGLVPDEKAPGGPASPAPSTAEPDGGEAE
jgi:hypothetical protein